ncbi:hypothetical protein BLD48_10145 [Exiguobacterium sp. KRL4]|uniref:hypothetical protein n=1 Tax=Exiguobacterium sp. KRL4 TaxID=1914536 RepID=UPI0008F91E66|nr:hypothetical protein [Exiguobacterium sp. KRL4]OIN66664.1 hypothetical protein BLD48_10145 [Exiguobacterium sp. KRL4]
MQRKLGLMIISVLVLAASLVAFERYVYTTYIYKPADYEFNYQIEPRKGLKAPTIKIKYFPSGPMIKGTSLFLPDILVPVGALVAAGLSIFVFRRLSRYRGRKQTLDPTDEGDPQVLRAKPSISDWRPQPQQTDSASEVRQLIAAFDRQLPDVSKRRPEETVKDWLDRIKLTIDPMLYHVVRYGEIDEQILDRADIDTLRIKLDQRLRG